MIESIEICDTKIDLIHTTFFSEEQLNYLSLILEIIYYSPHIVLISEYLDLLQKFDHKNEGILFIKSTQSNGVVIDMGIILEKESSPGQYHESLELTHYITTDTSHVSPEMNLIYVEDYYFNFFDCPEYRFYFNSQLPKKDYTEDINRLEFINNILKEYPQFKKYRMTSNSEFYSIENPLEVYEFQKYYYETEEYRFSILYLSLCYYILYLSDNSSSVNSIVMNCECYKPTTQNNLFWFLWKKTLDLDINLIVRK